MRADTRRGLLIVLLKLAAMAAAWVCVGAPPARAAELEAVGIHTVSVHVPAKDYQNNMNAGVFARWSNNVVVGGYYNTLERPSFYAGYVLEYGPFSLTVGAITGYQKKHEQVEGHGPNGTCQTDGAPPPCYATRGSTRGAVGLLLAPAVRLPTVLGLTPRVVYVPGPSARSVFHLTLERELK